MSLKSLMIVALVASVDARFGQENPKAVSEIAAVTSGGQPGEAATIAGASISNLLAAANPCAKYQTGDKILAQLGKGADAVKAAQDFVQAEQNFNPFNQKTPTLCSDPTLPSSAELRGILPLIDPAVGGADAANQLSAESLSQPFDATGKSVADIFAEQGFTNFTTKNLAGNVGAASGAVAPANNAGAGTGASNNAGSAGNPSGSGNTGAGGDASSGCSAAAVAPTTLQTVVASSVATAAPNPQGSVTAPSTSTNGLVGVAAQQAAENDASTGTSAQTSAGVDFGSCVPTIFRAAGQNGRKNTEFTFNAVDPKISDIQQEALNPNIITNRICDELTNQCGADQAAKALCQQAKAQILALGTRDQSTADAWNSALGF